jgi:hypothetical protein
MIERHQDPGAAETALQRVVTPESVLQNAQSIGSGRETLHRADIASVDLHCEREAGAGHHPVHGHGAGTADTVLASDVSAGRADLLTQKIRQQHAWLSLAVDGCPVQLEADPVPLV